jgi:hypothetical protein
MSAIIAVADWNVFAFATLFFLAQSVAREAGFFLGRRYGDKTDPQGAAVLVTAMLALMAFVLALTLSFSNTRFAERRAGTLAEANAIGTAWLRAQAVHDPHAAEISRLLIDYARARTTFVQASNDADALEAINERTSALQTEIWGHVTTLARERADPIVAALMTALNETFDMSAAERFAFSLRLPTTLFALLSGMALLSMAAIGAQLGARGTPHRSLAMLLTAVWTVVMVGILDLGSPRLGVLRTGVAPYQWTMETLQRGIPKGQTIP